MIKVLIMCKNLENAKKIINNIICKIEELQIIGISTSFEELNNHEADIVITTNCNIIKYIKERFITYNPGIIIIDNSIRIIDNYSKCLLINNSEDYSSIINKIEFFLKHSIQLSHKEKLIKILLNLGFDFNLAGTVYLLDSILFAHSFKGSYHFEKLKNDIYTHVSIIYNTSPDKVKWSIERSILYMYKKHSKITYYTVEKYLKIRYPEKPTPKYIISILANSLDEI